MRVVYKTILERLDEIANSRDVRLIKHVEMTKAEYRSLTFDLSSRDKRIVPGHKNGDIITYCGITIVIVPETEANEDGDKD